MHTRQFVAHARIDLATLDHWLQSGWLNPHENGVSRDFSQVDLARAQLIGDLEDLGINDEGMSVVLDLVDQLHGLRNVLRDVLTTVATQQGERP
jgi:chaperone modulatory protein CbpM